jgi:hypothetical protein
VEGSGNTSYLEMYYLVDVNYLGPDDTGTMVPSGTSTEFQMFNGLFWNTGKWSIFTSLKLYNHCDYRDSQNHDKLYFWFGLHRRF